MSEITKMVDAAEDQVFSLVRQAQDASVGAVKAVTNVVGGFVPELPSVPFADQLPTARELVDRVFAIAQRVLDAQRTYAQGIVDALAPITAKVPHASSNGTGVTTSKKS